MINQVAAEALYSATYVENYLDSVENLPDDVQRNLSRIREIDVQYRGHLRDVDYYYDLWSNCSTNELESANATKRTRTMSRIQQSLIAAQELGDEKLQIVTQLQELIDQKTRQLEQDFKALDYGKDEPVAEPPPKEIRPVTPALASPVNTTASIPVFPTAPVNITPSTMSNSNTERFSASSTTINSSERASKRARRSRNDTGSSGIEASIDANSSIEVLQKPMITSTAPAAAAAQKKTTATGGGKKKKRKSGRQTNANVQAAARETRDETPPLEEAIDPDEPTYCLCDQISFGEMILCDNDLCPIEWFHFSCVSLMSKPKGKWFCPNCRGDRPNVMKPKAQFLKELERYNKEKEEKT